MRSRDPFIASLHRLMAFARAVRVRRMIEGIALEPKQTFWIMTVNLLLESATIEWCEVFGSRDEQTHWTQVLDGQKHDEVRAGLLAAIGMSHSDWEAYWKTIVDYRNQMVAHHDLDAAVVAHPVFDPALTAAGFMFDQLRSHADRDWLGGTPTSLERWSTSAAANMRPIVAKAFAASAELGSNVRG